MLNRLQQQNKMEKTPRYTQRERNMVLNFAAQYKDIIENKRTDAESNRKKDEVWRTIAREFNARVYHQRTAKQLRQLYKNMKLLLKKDLSGDGRSKNFIDILNALSQQAAFYPSMAFRQNYKSEYEDDQKGTSSFSSDNIENDVMVIKSEDLSDNDQSVRNDMDDTISNKDIPEVCLEEDDEDYTDDNLNKIPSVNECDSLLSLAIEERRRKIELLNAQIEYWKALTRKLESTNSHCHCHMPRVNGVNQS